MGEASRSRALVPLPRPAPDAEPVAGSRLGDVDQWGRSERVRALVRWLYHPAYRRWFRAEWDGLGMAPAWLATTARTTSAKTSVERSLAGVESYVQDFAEENPHVNVALLRFANVLGTDIVTPISRASSLPVVPSIFGFDPMLQFVEEDDVVRALKLVMRTNISEIYNVAGDGRLPWSEVAAMVGKRIVPLPPVLTGLAAAPLARLGVVDLPSEMIDLLRYGRGVDSSRLQQAGFEYRYTTSGAVERFRKTHRVRKSSGLPLRRTAMSATLRRSSVTPRPSSAPHRADRTGASLGQFSQAAVYSSRRCHHSSAVMA